MAEVVALGSERGRDSDPGSLEANGSRFSVNVGRDHAASAATGIADLARSCGVTPRALRHYEAEGLLRPKRTRQGERLFTPRQCDIAHLIVQLRRMDVAIGDIRAFMDDAIPEGTRVLMMRRKLERQATQLSSRLASLRRCLEDPGSLTPHCRPGSAGRPVLDQRFG